jgi:ABC-2 type transport system ATP-binding protein
MEGENKLFIKAKAIQKAYGKKKVVKSISLGIQEKEILAVIGPNGAGKSTTLEMLIGLRQADAGEISYWHEQYKEKMGVQLQAATFFSSLTASENARLFGAFYRKAFTKKQVEKILSMCGLYEARSVEATKLSGGQQKRLAIVIATIHNPELLFLDEPTAALDPNARQEIHSLIRQLHSQGKTIVFTSHDMEEVDKLATRVIMIDQGNIIAEGKPAELCKMHQVSRLEELYQKLTTGGEKRVFNYL